MLSITGTMQLSQPSQTEAQGQFRTTKNTQIQNIFGLEDTIKN